MNVIKGDYMKYELIQKEKNLNKNLHLKYILA